MGYGRNKSGAIRAGLFALALLLGVWNLRSCTGVRMTATSAFGKFFPMQANVYALLEGGSMPAEEALGEVIPTAEPESTPTPEAAPKVLPPRKRPRPTVDIPTAPSPLVVAPAPEKLILNQFLILEGGIAFGSATVSPSIDNSCCRVGGVVGAALELDLSDTLSIVPGVRYGQRGGRSNISGSNVEVALDYLEVPFLFKYSVGTSKVRPFVLAGPVISFNTKAEGRSYGVVRDIRTQVRGVDLSMEAGVGVEIPIDRDWTLLVSNRLGLGLLDVDLKADSWYSRNFQFLGGLRYKLP